VWSSIKGKKITRPELTPRIIELKEKLIQDLSVISRISGGYDFTPECFQQWDRWYQRYDETATTRVCTDPAFNGWYSRKPTMILKIVQSIAASRSSSMLLNWDVF
jgi:hypothetical protein